MIQRLLESIKGVSFRRGLSLGALVGAAIAGSTLWSRVRSSREPPASSVPKAADDPGAPEV